MFGDVRGGGPVIFQHIFNEIDAPARAVQFISQQQVRRTGRRTEPAVHAFAQNIVGFTQGAGFKLFWSKIGLHLSVFQMF